MIQINPITTTPLMPNMPMMVNGKIRLCILLSTKERYNHAKCI